MSIPTHDEARAEFRGAVNEARVARHKAKSMGRIKPSGVKLIREGKRYSHPEMQEYLHKSSAHHKALEHAKKLTKEVTDWHSYNENH